MCGRYALGIRAAFVRHQFMEHGMSVEDDLPEDDDVRQTYNFAPGNHGLVYRADVPDHGAGHHHEDTDRLEGDGLESEDLPLTQDGKQTRYKLQSMKWGLVPFWTKRNPDYASVMKTINARDDSLMENRGMWNTMKQKKRCIVVAQGFYEWLKKNGGKEKIPHYIKRKDGQLMCFAGLWDCVQYEGSEEKLYTYTIITTSSNQQLKFLHDRMPVILENGSDQIRNWLDPNRSQWSKELQSLLKPFEGELECYPVSKDVGKVGNNSPTFIIPVASSENKNNIANFFSNFKGNVKDKVEERGCHIEEVKANGNKYPVDANEGEEERITVDSSRTEDNAPMPVPKSVLGLKHGYDQKDSSTASEPAKKVARIESTVHEPEIEPGKPRGTAGNRKSKSATSNNSGLKRSPAKAGDGSQRITNFFNK